MAVTTLEQTEAFSPGCDLWISPMANNTTLAGAIDWYINGQMTKALAHVPTAMAPALKEIVRSNELSPPSPTLRPRAPILIATQNQLPTRWIMLIDFTAPAKEWARELADSAQGLNLRKIRMFTDSDFSFQDFDKTWSQVGHNFDLQVIST